MPPGVIHCRDAGGRTPYIYRGAGRGYFDRRHSALGQSQTEVHTAHLSTKRTGHRPDGQIAISVR